MQVLVFTPNDADAALAEQLLRAEGFDAHAHASVSALAVVAQEDIGCIVLVEEALTNHEVDDLQKALAAQPAWSDLPLVLIAGQDTSLAGLVDRLFPESGNVTLLQRPLHPVTLASAVNVALRARSRQLEVRDLLTQRAAALQRRDEFLAMLAHELRNPLAPIRNAVHLLGTLDVRNPVFTRSRALIEKQAQHITRLVDDLLDVSRLELGKVDIRVQPIDLKGALVAAAEACLPMTTARDHKVHLDLPPDPVPILADPVRIEQVFSNLIVNAAKFTPPGGTITLRASSAGGMALGVVEDNGIGVRRENVDSVFDLFVQESSTIDRAPGGLGIGLTLVKRLVEVHGGTVRLSSAGIGRGTRVEVALPLSTTAPAVTTERPGAATSAAQRVLVVEDSPDIRESLAMLIAHWKHQVWFAGTGPEGVQQALALEPDIALIDIGLPGVDGYEVARRIRAAPRPWSSRVRLIAMTGYGQAEDRERAIGAGFDLHLLKPVDPRQLESILGQPG